MAEFRIRITSLGDGAGGNHFSDVNSLLLSGSSYNTGFHKMFIGFQNKKVKKKKKKTLE